VKSYNLKHLLAMLAVLIIFLVCSAMSLCKNQTTIRFAYNYTGSDPKAPIFEPYLIQFQKMNPDIHLVLEPQTAPMPDIEAKMYTAAAADNLPDVFQFWPGPGILKNLVDGQKIANLKDYVNKDPQFKEYFKQDFYYDGATRFQKGGPIWGLPCEMYYMFLAVNKKLFAKAGVAYPKTYEELKAIIPKLRAKGIIPITMAGKDQDLNVCFWFGLLNRYGTNNEIMKGMTTGDLGKYPAFLKSAQAIHELAGLQAFPTGCVSMQAAEALSLFDQEKAAMFYGGTWYFGNISAKTALDCDVIPLWTFADGKGDPRELMGGISQTYHVSAKSWKDPAKREAIDKFLHHLINPVLEKQFVNYSAPLLPVKQGKGMSMLVIKASQLEKNASRMTENYDHYCSQQGNDAMNSLSQALLTQTISPEEAIKKFSEAIKAGLQN
jgi:raffinose/stachyose/melibiose transport system substrate-binding protein